MMRPAREKSSNFLRRRNHFFHLRGVEIALADASAVKVCFLANMALMGLSPVPVACWTVLNAAWESSDVGAFLIIADSSIPLDLGPEKPKFLGKIQNDPLPGLASACGKRGGGVSCAP
jgi:hypothetical protein